MANGETINARVSYLALGDYSLNPTPLYVEVEWVAAVPPGSGIPQAGVFGTIVDPMLNGNQITNQVRTDLAAYITTLFGALFVQGDINGCSL